MSYVGLHMVAYNQVESGIGLDLVNNIGFNFK